jgi:hypothetical protein
MRSAVEEVEPEEEERSANNHKLWLANRKLSAHLVQDGGGVISEPLLG